MNQEIQLIHSYTSFQMKTRIKYVIRIYYM